MKGMTMGDRIWVALYAGVVIGVVEKWSDAMFLVAESVLLVCVIIADRIEDKWRE